MGILNKSAVLLATGFGLGYSPVIPGTIGCLLGIPLVWVLRAAGDQLGSGMVFQIAAAAVLSLLSIPLCTAGEKAAAQKDPHCVVADEYLTFPLSMLGLPFSPLVLVVAFVSNRVLDIVKPFPARQIQALPGGWGITLDDVFSALYSLAFNHIAYRLMIHYGLCPSL